MRIGKWLCTLFAVLFTFSMALAQEEEIMKDKSIDEEGVKIQTEDIEILRYRGKFKNFTSSTCNISVEYANGGVRSFRLRPNEVEPMNVDGSDRYCWTRSGAANPCRREVQQRQSYGCWGIPNANSGYAGCANSDVGYYRPNRCLP